MSHHLTFEERFAAFVPHETRVSSLIENERKIHEHDEAWIIVKLIAYLIDFALTLLLLPIIYNIYHYFKRWQTLWQQVIGIRIYHFRHHGKPIIASISQLLLRFCSKLLFLGSWVTVGVTITPLWFSWYPYGNNVDLSYKMLYLCVMICRIHGYVFSMGFNKHHRGLQDIRAGTVVAYDAWFQIKRLVLWLILCVCLYYFILVVGPKIMIFVVNQTQWSWVEIYRSFWAWIDYWVLHGIYAMWLAN